MLATRIALISLVVLMTAVPAQAQDQLASARQLYASADYDEALQVLDKLSARASSTAELQAIELYRTLCLLAVGRHQDADRTIEAMIARDPLYRLGDELSPRTRTTFSDVKKRVLPTIVQQQYAAAKDAFERQEFETAAATFKRVIDALNDPDIGVAAKQAPLSDLRMLAAGFHDLSVKAIAPPPAPLPPTPPPTVRPAPAADLPARIYTGEEAGVRSPVVLAQQIPNYPGAVPSGGLKAIVEVVVDKTGSVESALMVMPVRVAVQSGARSVPVASSYDKMVLSAASKWQFEPATLDGAPVKFRKRLQINIAPTTR